jgi:hypothetical protein
VLNTAAVLPIDLQRLLDDEILQDERVLWSCQPSLKRAFRRGLPLVFFAVVWLGISSTIAVAIFRDANASWFAKIFIRFFILIGLVMLSSPLWMVQLAKNTVYIVTDRRVIILTKGTAIHIQSFGPDRLAQIDKRVFRDGSGDLIFDRQVSTHYSKGRQRESVKEIGFFGIPHVAQVHTLIRDSLQASKT